MQLTGGQMIVEYLISEGVKYVFAVPGHGNTALVDAFVDYKDRIEVVYHLFSYKHRHGAVLKVKLPRENPSIETVESVWKSANWMEREIFDLLGVTFEGHSDMRRILMPEDWIGHPLRKDFVEPAEYHGISTVRESPIIRLNTKTK